MNRNYPGRRFVLTSACLLLALAVVAPREARGQLLHGTINGNVTDPSAAAIAGAKVVATEQATQFARDAVTSAAGVYTLPDMPPGTYTVVVTAPGFETYKLTGVGVTAQTITRVDTVLTVGAVSESLTISAEAAALQTDRADVHSDITGSDLSNLPVPIGRNYEMLFVTIPGVSPPQDSHSFGSNSTRSLSFTTNGASVYTNDVRVDGASTRNFSASDASAEYIPALEAIETVNVATNAFGADQTGGGGYVNVTVKSGTNAIHGALFEDHADRDLNAYQWLANRNLPKLPYIENQFGGTVGGPIKKDKVFYFVSYEGTRLVQGNAVAAEVPTAAMKTGNLSGSPTAMYDPLTGTSTGSGRTPFPSNIIPASRIDPGVQALIATGAWPNPNQAGTGSLGLGNDFLCSGCQGNSGMKRNQVDGKVTWNPSTKLSTFARLGANEVYWYDPQIFGELGGTNVSPTNGAVGSGHAHVYNGTLSASYVFNSHLFVDAYFGFDGNYMTSQQPYANQNLGWTLLGIPGLNTSSESQAKQLQQGGLPLIAIAGFASLGPANNYQPQNYNDPEMNYNGSINWIKGTHNIRAGFDIDVQNSKEMQYQAANGTSSYAINSGGFNFAQGTTQVVGGPSGNDYNAFGGFLLGLPQTAGKIYQFPDYYYTHQSYESIYIRDQWQVLPKLTLTYGLRGDDFPFPTRNGTGMEFYNAPSSTMSICGVGSTPTNCGITKDRLHAAPRLGVAYRLSNSTVIRAGYGISTDPDMFTGKTASSRLNFPYIYAQVVSSANSYSPATTFREGLPAVTAPNISSGTVPVPGNVALVTYDNSDYIRGYVQTWNFTAEQRVKNWLLSAGYVGTRAVDPQDDLQENWSPINGGTAGEILNRLTGRTASTVYLGTTGTNTYDGIQARAQGHFGILQIGSAYVFAKALGYSITPQVVIPQYFEVNRGPQATDITQMLSATAIADLPFGKGKRWAQSGAGSMLAGGWQLSTVVVAHTGLPFTATTSGTSLNSPNSGQFANCLSGPQKVGNVYEWYSPSTFGTPSSGLGSCGTDNLWGPGLINADLGVMRRFQLSERFQLQFRAEMFNVANTPHHGVPVGNVNSSTFMEANTIISTGREGVEQRALRFSLHLGF